MLFDEVDVDFPMASYSPKIQGRLVSWSFCCFHQESACGLGQVPVISGDIANH
jgi:hypothetical protein